MKIIIKSIPHKEERYNTVGDYWLDRNGTIQMRVTKCEDVRHEWLILVHEMIEMVLTKFQNVPWKSIDRFDKMAIDQSTDGEPGDRPDAPYYHQHHIATAIEQLIAEELGVNWEQYNDETLSGM